MRTIAVATLTIVGLAAYLLCTKGGNARSAVSSLRASTAAYTTVSPADLRTAFRTSELAKASGFRDEPLALTGVAIRVDRGPTGETYVAIDDWAGEQRLPEVEAMFEKGSKVTLESLRARAPIIVRCPSGVSDSDSLTIRLRNCTDLRDLRFVSMP